MWKVKLKKNGKYYALKEMSKVKIIDKKSEKSIIGERDFLCKLKHPFIINMTCAFQDYENLYLLLDFLSGGDLRYHFNLDHKFTENEIKFFISCLILSLEYIHSNNIIHRDIKPENLVFDEKGYLHLTDFGVAKIISEEKISDTSGTPGYMAPEVIQGKNHSYPVDFFAIGIIGYELLIGHRPYRGKNRKEIKRLMSSEETEILITEEDNTDNDWSEQCINFINSCLKLNVEKRLGYHNGLKELKEHNWFDKYDWIKLYNKKHETSFVPKDEKNYDQKHCEGNDKISDSTLERYKEYMRRDNYLQIFEGYTFFNNDGLTVNTYENETVTRVSTNTRANKQDMLENEVINGSMGNIYLGPNSNNTKSKLKGLNIKNGGNKNDMRKILLEKKLYENIHNKEAEIFKTFIKEKAIKKILIPKKENFDTIEINKKILRYELYNKITENENKIDSKTINKEKSENKNLILKDIINNKKDFSPIKIKNNIKIFDEKETQLNNDINLDIKNKMMKKYNNKDINILNIIKNNNSSINLMENKNFNIPKIKIKRPDKIPLNIHNLSGRDTKEKEYSKEKIKESLSNNNFPLYSQFLNQSRKNKISNNAFILPDIRHFNFRITNKKKIRHMYLNQNRIIENNNTNQENKHSKILEKYNSKYPLSNNKKYEKISEETYQKNEINKNSKGKLLKSQSSIFPLINNI